MKKVMLALMISGMVMIGNCSDTGDCPGTNPTCQPLARAILTVEPSRTVEVGQEVTLDASGSDYDDISWTLNGEPIDRCKQESSCSLTFGTVGIEFVGIRVTTNEAAGGLFSSKQDTSDSAIAKLTIVSSSCATAGSACSWALHLPSDPGQTGIAEGGGVVHQDKLWIIGGSTQGTYVANSDNGLVWTTVNVQSGSSEDFGGVLLCHTALAYKGLLWSIGGWNGTTHNNRAHFSSDGAHWTIATTNGAWSPRRCHGSVVFAGKMWVMGGQDGSNYFNDVWTSIDGVTWTQVNATGHWSARSQFAVTVFNEKIWVFGGNSGSSRLNDIWNSEDGMNWTQVSAAAEWGARQQHTSLVYDSRLWILGGTPEYSVWSSTDGSAWKSETNGDWIPRSAHTSLVYEDRIWLIGGYRDSLIQNDVWSYGLE